MLTDSQIQRARTRLTQPAFAAAAARLRAEVQEDLARPVLVPPPDQPAGYYHDYFCPQHGVQLEFHWDSPRAHRCPVDGAHFRGQPYDRSWWWFVNHAHSEAGFRLALAWRLLDDHASLERLRAILAAYAAGYPQAGWPADDPRSRQGKVAYHALDEAVWLIPLAWGYALARDGLPARTRQQVETRLLLPAAEHLLRQRWQQVHNYMCWLNAGVAAAATLVGRGDLVAQVIDGPYGFHQQVAEGVLADGTWWEGTASYHYYTLAAVLAMVRSVEQPPAGGPLQRLPKVRRMFLAPLRWAYPDLSLPAINDCWYHSSLVGEVGHGIPPAAPFYEVAAGWYGDASFAAILAANYRRGQPRDSLEALLFGPHDLPAPGARPPRLLTASSNLDELGVAVLRGPDSARPSRAGATPGAGSRTFLLLKYGRHGGGHGHPDKLGIILAGAGARLSPDLGTPGYGIALNDTWYRHTLSHNTVLIEGRPQPAATGRLLAFAPPGRGPGAFGLIDAAVEWPGDAHDAVMGATRQSPAGSAGQSPAGSAGQSPAGSAGEVRRASAEVPAAYQGVRLRRLVLLRHGYVLDVFAVACPEARQIDWVYHNLGRLAGMQPAGSRPGALEPIDGPPLSEPLRLTQAAAGQPDLRLSLVTGAAGLELWLRGVDAPGALVAVAGAPANPASDTMALVLRRCHAPGALFAAVFDLHHGRPAVQSVTWSADAGVLRCVVQRRASTDHWTIPLATGNSRRPAVTVS